jgi:uncharacterized protein (TIGR03663 family)
VTTQPSLILRWTIFIGLAVLALAIRLPQLGSRPMHTDEAVNGYIIGRQLAGEKFKYDPQDRHGPVLYLLAKPVAQLGGAKNLAGLTEVQLRLTTVLVGSATVLLFGAAVEMFGFIPCLIAALLFAVGPLPVYYSRYFIHETLFVAATWGLMLAGWTAMKNNSFLAAALAGLCAAAMLACKETAVIHFFALGAAGITWQMVERKNRRSATGQPEAGLEPVTTPAPVSLFKLLVTALGIFLAASILLFRAGWRAGTRKVIRLLFFRRGSAVHFFHRGSDRRLQRDLRCVRRHPPGGLVAGDLWAVDFCDILRHSL